MYSIEALIDATERVTLLSRKKEVIEANPLFSERIVDVCKAAEVMNLLPDTKSKVIVNYIFDNVNNSLYVITHNGQVLNVSEIVVPKTRVNHNFMTSIYSYYWKHFLSIDKDSYDSAEYGELLNISKIISNIFIVPLFSLIPNPESIHFIIAQNILCEDQELLFDLPYIADLRYFFSLIETNDELIFTSVTHRSIYVFLSNLCSIQQPVNASIVLLYGLKKQDSEEYLQICKTETERNAAMTRERAYQKIFKLLSGHNAKVLELESLEQFDMLFRNDYKGTVIQLLTHFHHDRLFTKILTSIRFKDIEQLIDVLEKENSLRNDIVIDAIACSTHASFSRLYAKNIKYIFSSRHDLSNDLASFMLYELYSGENAKRLNWKYPYFDGKTYIHEAWSNVIKCFYTTMNKYGQIRVP